MIGVVADPLAVEVVEEFFQLFKTPWELAVPGRSYRVVLSASESRAAVDARVMLVYGAAQRPIDDEVGNTETRIRGPIDVEFDGERVPLYNDVSVFAGDTPDGFLTSPRGSITYRHQER